MDHMELDSLDLMDLNDKDLADVRSYKPTLVDFPPQEAVTVPSKFLGLWLADGSRGGPVIANYHEEEVVQYCQQVCAQYDLHLKYYGGATAARA